MINNKRRKTLNKIRERERITNEVLQKKYMENKENLEKIKEKIISKYEKRLIN